MLFVPLISKQNLRGWDSSLRKSFQEKSRESPLLNYFSGLRKVLIPLQRRGEVERCLFKMQIFLDHLYVTKMVRNSIAIHYDRKGNWDRRVVFGRRILEISKKQA